MNERQKCRIKGERASERVRKKKIVQVLDESQKSIREVAEFQKKGEREGKKRKKS